MGDPECGCSSEHALRCIVSICWRARHAQVDFKDSECQGSTVFGILRGLLRVTKDRQLTSWMPEEPQSFRELYTSLCLWICSLKIKLGVAGPSQPRGTLETGERAYDAISSKFNQDSACVERSQRCHPPSLNTIVQTRQTGPKMMTCPCKSSWAPDLVAPHRTILRYYRCYTPYRAILLQQGSHLPKMVRHRPLVLTFTQGHLCDTPFCNILRDHCAIPLCDTPPKTSTKKFCNTIATSIARYDKYRCWASKAPGGNMSVGTSATMVAIALGLSQRNLFCWLIVS